MGLKSMIRVYKVKKSIKRVTKSRKKAIVARSKRVGVEFGIKHKKNINGREYYAHDWKRTNKTAKSIADGIRRGGDHARVLRLNGGYAVYVSYT